MRPHVLAVGLLAVVLFVSQAKAQDGKVAVSVSHSGEDSAGKQFAYAIREAIRASNGLRGVNYLERSATTIVSG